MGAARALPGDERLNALLRESGTPQRLTARFGAEVQPWLDALPAVLRAAFGRWELAWDAVIPHGTMAVVVRCTLADGRPAVLKASPDRARLAHEAAALRSWRTPHAPALLALDEEAGAMLIEAIEPGIQLAESGSYPHARTVAELLSALYETSTPSPSFPSLEERVAYLFESGMIPYRRRPELVEVVPLDLYRRGRTLATRLLEAVRPTAVLHGDLTPRNILDGGPARGLVAIDPAPCLGDDVAFDAVDLLLWQADDVETIEARAVQLARVAAIDAERLVGWCVSFAAMTALEHAESEDVPLERLATYLALANRA
ncbi:MAG: aminoglycoside phosphotransferase family protein [Dehalococcoidia bacterium]